MLTWKLAWHVPRLLANNGGAALPVGQQSANDISTFSKFTHALALEIYMYRTRLLGGWARAL